jgi:aminoglycoside 6'-N-acetyltransferase I
MNQRAPAAGFQREEEFMPHTAPDSTPEFHVRPIVAADAPSWLALRLELWPDGAADHAPEIAAFFRGSLREPEAVLAAQNSAGVMVAFAELSIRTGLIGLQAETVGYVEGLYVRPEFRQQGIARKLLQASRQWARGRKCTGFASDRAGRVVIDKTYK